MTSTDYRDGSSTLMATGPKARVAELMAALDAMSNPKQPGDERSLPQRRFDTLMDLVSGRREPGQWEATVLISLATLEGGNEPAEIPGQGLITATEAREILSQARVRRAVVDENGVLVGVDVRVEAPDLTPQLAEPCTVTDLLEPEPLDDLDDGLSQEDLSSYLSWQGLEGLYPVAPVLAWFQQDLITAVEEYLKRSVTAQVLTDYGNGAALVTVASASPEWRAEPNPFEGPEGPRDGPAGPPVPPSIAPRYWTGPEPEPASWSDTDWDDTELDREALYSALDERVAPARVQELDPVLLPRQQTRAGAWSSAALARLSADLRSRTPDPLPADTTSYALPPRMARHVKLRDVTCTFPGCTRLAQRCDNDHLVEYPLGTTSCRNVASECEHHHQCKHAIMTVLKLSCGTLRWSTSYGLVVDRPPRPLLRGW